MSAAAVRRGGPALRFGVRLGDAAALEALVRETGVFSDEECGYVPEILAELARDGEAASGYRLLVAEDGGEALGFAIWGPKADDPAHHDLYWIACAPGRRRGGTGRALFAEALARARAEGAREMSIETATSAPYAPARAFYEAFGFRLIETRDAYYPNGDGLALYHARLTGEGR